MDGGREMTSGVRKRRKAALIVLPFVPVVLAVGVALGVHFWPRAEAAGLGAGDATGRKAPDFILFDAQQKEDAPPAQLSKLVKKGPVMVTFIPSFGCKKCLMYLDALVEHVPAFKEAGLEQIVVISPGAYENLREILLGMDPATPFPVLSDFEGDHYGDTAAAFGMADDAGMVLYGTFVVDRDMRVAFADKADEPFTDWEKLVEVGKGLRH